MSKSKIKCKTISTFNSLFVLVLSFRTCCETIKIRRSMRLLVSQAKDVLLKFALNRHQDIYSSYKEHIENGMDQK